MFQYFIIGLMAFSPMNVKSTNGYAGDNYQYNVKFETYSDGMTTFNTEDYDSKQNAQLRYNAHFTWRLNYSDKYHCDLYIENLIVDYFTVDRTILDNPRELTYTFTHDRDYFYDHGLYKIPHDTDLVWYISCTMNEEAGMDYYWSFFMNIDDNLNIIDNYHWDYQFYTDYPEYHDMTTYFKYKVNYNLLDRYFDYIVRSPTTGYDDGYNDGLNAGYGNGYNDGYNDGFNSDVTITTIFNGILNVALVPINFFLAIFNFEILGINFSAIISGILTLCCLIIVIRLFMGGKNND